MRPPPALRADAPRRLLAGGLASLLVAACAHAPQDAHAEEVLAVTVAAARYALEHDVPPVLREPSAVCLEVDGQPPATEVVSRLSAAGVQLSPGPAGCAGPLALLVQVKGVTVEADRATAYAGVRLGRGGQLALRKVNGTWQGLPPPGAPNEGPRLSLPLGG